MGKYNVLVVAGVLTVVQAGVQLICCSLALAQYFCVIDFLRELPMLLYVRILYYHNPNPCGNRINIGHAIDGIADQAFVLLMNEPLTTFRTFIINCTSLGLSVFWLVASAILMTSSSKTDGTKPVRWPWVLVTIAVCSVDVVACVIFANDSFHTRTLDDVMDYVGGVASGIGNTQLDTSFAAWLMVIVYSRFVVFFFLNVLFLVLVAIMKIDEEKLENIDNLEAQMPPNQPPQLVAEPTPVPLPPPPTEPVSTVENNQNTTRAQDPVERVPIERAQDPVERVPIERAQDPVERVPIERGPEPAAKAVAPLTSIAERQTDSSNRDTESSSVREEAPKIPRVGINHAFRRMKTLLFAKSASPVPRRISVTDSLDMSLERSPQTQRLEVDKKRTVNFPENLLSLPQRLENMIAEQQRRLDKAVIDTAGRYTPPRASQSLPQLNEANQDSISNVTRGRRGTAAELQGQMPWAYIPASAHPMRDQLPPDEDLPPVPLPDYTAIPSFRKASVHRAASSISSITHKRDYSQRNKSPLTQSDVLY